MLDQLKETLLLAKSRRSGEDLKDLIAAVEAYLDELEGEYPKGSAELVADLTVVEPFTPPSDYDGSAAAAATAALAPAAEQGADIGDLAELAPEAEAPKNVEEQVADDLALLDGDGPLVLTELPPAESEAEAAPEAPEAA